MPDIKLWREILCMFYQLNIFWSQPEQNRNAEGQVRSTPWNEGDKWSATSTWCQGHTHKTCLFTKKKVLGSITGAHNCFFLHAKTLGFFLNWFCVKTSWKYDLFFSRSAFFGGELFSAKTMVSGEKERWQAWAAGTFLRKKCNLSDERQTDWRLRSAYWLLNVHTLCSCF